MQISGHKTRSIFDRYNIVNEENVKLACERMAMRHEENKANLEDAQNNHNLITISNSR